MAALGKGSSLEGLFTGFGRNLRACCPNGTNPQTERGLSQAAAARNTKVQEFPQSLALATSCGLRQPALQPLGNTPLILPPNVAQPSPAAGFRGVRAPWAWPRDAARTRRRRRLRYGGSARMRPRISDTQKKLPGFPSPPFPGGEEGFGSAPPRGGF